MGGNSLAGGATALLGFGSRAFNTRQVPAGCSLRHPATITMSALAGGACADRPTLATSTSITPPVNLILAPLPGPEPEPAKTHRMIAAVGAHRNNHVRCWLLPLVT